MGLGGLNRSAQQLRVCLPVPCADLQMSDSFQPSVGFDIPLKRTTLSCAFPFMLEAWG